MQRVLSALLCWSPRNAQSLLLHCHVFCPELIAKIALVGTDLESGCCPNLKLFPAGPDPPDVSLQLLNRETRLAYMSCCKGS